VPKGPMPDMIEWTVNASFVLNRCKILGFETFNLLRTGKHERLKPGRW
jgi:hypothetical protein